MRWKNFPVESQLDLKDCGPACLKIIARYYGKFYSLQYLREECGISRQGVSLFDLAHAAENIGFRSLSVKTTMADLYGKAPLPCIAYWDSSHFIVVYKVTRKRVYVSDPSKGRISYTHSDFIRRWHTEDNKGIILALEPQADFKQRYANEKKPQRKKTIENILGYFIPYKKKFFKSFYSDAVYYCVAGSAAFYLKICD